MNFLVGLIFNSTKPTKLRDNYDFQMIDFNTTAIERSRSSLLLVNKPKALASTVTNMRRRYICQ